MAIWWALTLARLEPSVGSWVLGRNFSGAAIQMLLLITLSPVLVLVDKGERLRREILPEVSSEGLESLQHQVHLGLPWLIAENIKNFRYILNCISVRFDCAFMSIRQLN